ncbi:3-keto-disaccharide hydrolase [Hymenobacter arizonensis]|uniref:3-keto-alpha-glucoside-1,2-lyase/3-keto-2-hydroxy-glucal hydratase domain-containing protein n=1 Tax=Hymenobacter arizonensis TaxID=1227077 RepID=A0A1I6A7P6_HYMAR|nr:DUF1080 domain-containing protein [Hymenobacter arizonensis]SFQ64665.1 protein of unknown function [Hymenobacter arizonensis]
MHIRLVLLAALAVGAHAVRAQQTAKPEDTEVHEPVPKVVTPGRTIADPPADAVVLFGGKNLDQWVSTENRSAPAKWTVGSGGVFTVNKAEGNIETKRSFGNYQLHLEWRVPANISGTGQVRGNSGIFLASLGKGDLGYELQILDAYQNQTYVNGMAGSIYKQAAPLANPARKPGEWQTYDVVWTAPTFTAAGAVATPAYATVFFNGVLVQNHVALAGPTQYIGKAYYQQTHGPAPIKLQAHGDKSEPLSFRNIWVRELP